jgi:uncharacterized protein YndB with AHSA1/START domain
MATAQTQPQNSLEVRRTFAAPRERVFRAWTDAKELALWFHPTTDHTTIVTRLDLKVGGSYSVEMHHKGGGIHKISGTYQQIKPPEKLSFTWSYANDPNSHETLVKLDFIDLGNNSTEVVISHGQFLDVETRDKHNEGWNGCLEQLRAYLATPATA